LKRKVIDHEEYLGLVQLMVFNDVGIKISKNYNGFISLIKGKQIFFVNSKFLFSPNLISLWLK